MESPAMKGLAGEPGPPGLILTLYVAGVSRVPATTEVGGRVYRPDLPPGSLSFRALLDTASA